MRPAIDGWAYVNSIEDEGHRHYDIERQVRRDPSYGRRSAYYLCKLYAGQLLAGDAYDSLTPVIGIHFLDFDHFPAAAHEGIWHWLFEWRARQHPDVRLTEDLS